MKHIYFTVENDAIPAELFIPDTVLTRIKFLQQSLDTELLTDESVILEKRMLCSVYVYKDFIKYTNSCRQDGKYNEVTDNIIIDKKLICLKITPEQTTFEALEEDDVNLEKIENVYVTSTLRNILKNTEKPEADIESFVLPTELLNRQAFIYIKKQLLLQKISL